MVSSSVLSEHTTAQEREEALRDLHKLQHAEQYYVWLQGFVDQLREGKLYEQKAEIPEQQVRSALLSIDLKMSDLSRAFLASSSRYEIEINPL